MATFAELGLDPALIKALQVMAIKLPTEVQSACIPPILSGRDCIGNAQTGSGKTMAFALPIMQALSQDPHGFFALVLTPTRELAFQIHDQFRALGPAINLQSVCIVGGLDMMEQASQLAAHPHVVVATPGRLVDLLSNSYGQWSLSRLRFLVLDEADRLLAPSFAQELSTIIKELPASRQTLLFTATVTDSILALQNKEPMEGKQKPFVHLSKQEISLPSTLIQRYVFVPSTVRDCYLYYLLSHLPSLASIKPGRQRKTKSKANKAFSDDPSTEDIEPLPQCIVFVSRCKTAAHLSTVLTELDVPNAPLHSHLTQKERLASLERFRANAVPLLVATDVGSRGLDIPQVQAVINWDLPRDPDDYIHRVGRTARAGKGGVAISVITEGDVELVQAIEERAGAKMAELPLPEERVLDSLNKVSTAQRMASVYLRSEKAGERAEINRKKAKLLAKAVRPQPHKTKA